MVAGVPSLSEREKEALRLLFAGHDAKSIANALGLSVHTVNERLRGARRKLGVGSSREAARVLAASEGQHEKIVSEQLGVAGAPIAAAGQERRDGDRYSRRQLVLAVGGACVMSVLLAAGLFMSITPNGEARTPLGHWRQTPVVPSEPGPVNRLHVTSNGWQWNGRTVAEPLVADFLRLVNGMTPPPLMMLSHAQNASPASLQRARQLIDRELACDPRRCVEVTAAN